MNTCAESSSYAFRIGHATVSLNGRVVLNDVSWQLRRGGRAFLLGANGAGKTTLVRMLLGHVWPRYGATVEVLGRRFGAADLSEVRRRIAWVSPCLRTLAPPGLAALELVVSGAMGMVGNYAGPTPEMLAEARRAMELMGCAGLADRSMDEVSSGEALRLQIARALCGNPELLILDEPGVYLDLAGRERLLANLETLAERRPELALLFITQRIEDVLPLFSEGMILKEGRVLASGPRRAVLTAENLRRLFDLPVRLVENSSGRLWTVLEPARDFGREK